MIGQYLIDLVDEAGYLPRSGQAAGGAGVQKTSKPSSRAAEIRSRLRVCARLERMPGDQLRELNRYDPAMQALWSISICWRSAISRRCELCGVDDEESPT